MAISFNTGTTTTVTNSGTASGTLTIPAGVLNGDTILVLVWAFTTATGTLTNHLTSTVTAPVQVGSSQLSTGASIQALGSVFRIAAGASDHGATLTFTTTGGTGGAYWYNVGLVAYTGAGGVDVSNGTSFFTASGTGTTTTPSATTTVSGDWQVQLLGVGPPGGNSFTTPAGLTSRASIPNNAGLTLAIADSNASVGGAGTAIGNTTWTYTGATGNVWSTSFVVGLQLPSTNGPAGTVQPRATVPVPRRRAARASWASALGPANAHGGNGRVQPKPVIARRTAARAYVRFTPVATVNATGPIPPTVRLAHGFVSSRRPVGGLWAGSYTPQANASGPSGTTQPRATIPVPRRQAARGLWRGPAAVTTTNAIPVLPPGSVQPRATVPVPRRAPSRALIAHVLGPANAHGPDGSTQSRAAVPVPRRAAARAVTASALGPANAHGPSGTTQPRATIPVPRRLDARGVWASILGPANAHGPAGTVQPAATRQPRRTAARAVFKGSPLITASAIPVPGTVQPSATAPHRPHAFQRAVWRGIAGSPPPLPPGIPVSGGKVFRRTPARGLWHGPVPVTANAHGPAVPAPKMRPRITSRASARGIWRGTPLVTANGLQNVTFTIGQPFTDWQTGLLFTGWQIGKPVTGWQSGLAFTDWQLAQPSGDWQSGLVFIQ